MAFRFLDFPAARDDLRADVLAGLAASPKAIPPKYFYDEAGCRLFEAICAQPEYVLCRTERALMAAHLPEIAAAIGAVDCVIEPGAGDCGKVRAAARCAAPQPAGGAGHRRGAARRRRRAARRRLPQRGGDRAGHGLHSQPGSRRAPLCRRRRLVYYPGSSIGNFAPADAAALLARFRQLAARIRPVAHRLRSQEGPVQLHRAYNDAAGVTAAFNLNLLARLNRELEADFDLNPFRHYAFYNPIAGRIEMHLVSLIEQNVNVAGQRFHFNLGEALHTENSYKFRRDEFSAIAGRRLASGRRMGTRRFRDPSVRLVR